MQTIAVTGVNGFVGPHLALELKNSGLKVCGIGREKEPEQYIKSILDDYLCCDLTKTDEIARLPLDKFSSIINLAGMANVGESFNEAAMYEKVNVDIITNIANVISSSNTPIRLLTISTGAVYDPSQAMPLTEQSTLVNPSTTSPYVRSKLSMEKVALHYREEGLDCVIARPFNHIGPGQKSGFLVPDLYKKIVDASKTNESVKVGNLNTRRDYTDVRDVVRAYRLLATLPKNKLTSTMYNICSGKSRSGFDIVNLIKQLVPESNKVAFEADQSLIRASDPLELLGSYDRLHKDTGWSPLIKIEQTMADFASNL